MMTKVRALISSSFMTKTSGLSKSGLTCTRPCWIGQGSYIRPVIPESVCKGFLLKISCGIRLPIIIISSSSSSSCEKSVSTFYCPSLSQTSTVGKVSVKLFHKLSKTQLPENLPKTSSLQAEKLPNYFSCQQNTSRLPKLQTKQQKHKQGQKYLCHPLLLDKLCTRKTKSI